MSQTYITLNNGIKIPQVGFGCWKVDNATATDQIYEAIKVGYRLFDGAMDYGNEKEIGEGFKKAINDGLVKREDLIVVSKLWNSFHDPKNVTIAINKVLSDLQLDYLDVFYIHFPIAQKFVPIEEKYPPGFYCGSNGWEFENVPISETWKALENLVDLGKVKSIGISNFNGALIQDLLRSARIKPQLLQIEHHPYLVQPRLIKYANDNEIAVTAYSSFGPQSFIELNHPKVKDVVSLFNHDTINKIASNHNVSNSKILLRWATQRGLLIIPKSNKKERLLENFTVNDFDLSQNEIDEISNLDIGLRFNDPWTWGGDAEIPIFI
jgi:D-xylose reductase